MKGIDEYREPLLVWIRPTLASLTFIQQQVNKLGLGSISSVGCGCGTLEWLIQVCFTKLWLGSNSSVILIFQAATGIKVTGYEVNRIWWEGVHSTPHYIDMGEYSLRRTCQE